MSAPLRPAARTRTSNSPACGVGSGCSWTAIAPSMIVAALTDGDPTCTDGGSAGPLGGVMRMVMGVPRLPYVPPLWRESRVGFEVAQLLRSPVWRGVGVPPGEGRAVMLIPGFLAGDGSLSTMTRWLRANGYRT